MAKVGCSMETVGIMKPEKAIINAQVQHLVSDSCEALIRFYRAILDGDKPNPIFLEAHKANMKEAWLDYGTKIDTYTAALIQTLCCTIINIFDEEDDEE